jgi:hypothetical protein
MTRAEQMASFIKTGLAFKTPSQYYGANINSLTQVQVTIFHLPPSWAVSYQLLRTAQLTYDKIFNWLTKSAFQGTVNANTYVYLGIDNITDYNANIQASSTVVSYDFAPGDRVRFNARWYADGISTVDLTSTYKDYEVLSVEVNPKHKRYCADGKVC